MKLTWGRLKKTTPVEFWEPFVLYCANNLIGNKLKNEGFAIFATNLMLKKLSPLFDVAVLNELDTPLNKDELDTVGAKDIGVSSISHTNTKNYKKVMGIARAFAKKR